MWYWISEAFVVLDLYFYYIFFFSSGVIKLCWGDLGKTAITDRHLHPSALWLFTSSQELCTVLVPKWWDRLGLIKADTRPHILTPTPRYQHWGGGTRRRRRAVEAKQQCEEKRDKHRTEELCKHVGAAALQQKIRLKNNALTKQLESLGDATQLQLMQICSIWITQMYKICWKHPPQDHSSPGNTGFPSSTAFPHRLLS